MTKLEELKITSANARAAVDATYDAAHDAYKEELEKQENSND
jgi:hypothetical protein